MKHRAAHVLVISFALIALVASACAGPIETPSNTPSVAVDDQGDVTALIDKAKQEGTVTWMTSTPEAVAKVAAEAFKQKYGINVSYLAQNDGILQQRYQTEAEAGKVGTDVMTVVESGTFFSSAIQKGWAQSLKAADLPAMKLGSYPAEFNQGDTASVFLFLFLIWYNKDKLAADLVPKSVEDLADPKYKGKLILTDPSSSDGLLKFYDVMQQKYGDSWFTKIKANAPKFYPTASAGVQALAAGEGALATPAVKAVGAPLVTAGAPLASVTPTVTTGGELRLLLSATDKAPHPNAAKLFANWLVSESGNKAAQAGLSVSVYAKDELPSGWVSSRPITPEIRAKILSLLGLG